MTRAGDHLRRHGVAIDLPAAGAGCQRAVEFRDPDNHGLEIYWGMDQIGSDGAVGGPRTERRAEPGEALANPVRRQDTTLQAPTLLEGERRPSTR